eukprot:SM000005S17170  [mRNA]  locus=s5:505080:506134:- [translate_table: standard]
MYIFIRGVWSILAVQGGETIPTELLYMFVAGATASIFGTFGIKRSRRSFIWMYIICTSATLTFSGLAMITGGFIDVVREQWKVVEAGGDYNRLALTCLEGGQDLIGAATQMVAIPVAASLAQNMATSKSKKSS